MTRSGAGATSQESTAARTGAAPPLSAEQPCRLAAVHDKKHSLHRGLEGATSLFSL